MSMYTVTQLARLSGVSVRALHHYDAIGLLKPAHVGDNSYRYYGRAELLRLQDILFHRELGVPLAKIAELLDAGEEDRLGMLKKHRRALSDRIEQTRSLLDTIDRTIAEIDGGQDMKDADFFKGFAPEKQDEYEDWLAERGGQDMTERIADSKAHLMAGGRDAMEARMAEMAEAEAALAEQFRKGVAIGSAELAPLLDRHRQWIASMWGRDCPPEAYAGMADMYLAHPDFRTHFDKHGEGFLDWLAEAMKQANL